MMVNKIYHSDAHALALSALGWTLDDEWRARRLLDMTGLTPDDLRERLGDRATMAALLRFLEAHEPDLIACADSLGVSPAALVEARRCLEERE